MYLEIATTGNYSLLIKKGHCSFNILTERWEEIVKANSVESGTFDYLEYFELSKSLSVMVSEYHIVKAMLCKLQFMVDVSTIEYLQNLGYKIVTTGKYVYRSSLLSASKKSDSLQTKIRRKQNEILLLHSGNKSGEGVTFEKIIARLSAGLSFAVNRELTLAEYNEYLKILKERNKNGNRKETDIQ